MTYIIAILIILGLLAAWIGVQHLARKFAEKHPECGPHSESPGGCGFFCFCKHRDTCKKRAAKTDDEAKEVH